MVISRFSESKSTRIRAGRRFTRASPRWSKPCSRAVTQAHGEVMLTGDHAAFVHGGTAVARQATRLAVRRSSGSPSRSTRQRGARAGRLGAHVRRQAGEFLGALFHAGVQALAEVHDAELSTAWLVVEVAACGQCENNPSTPITVHTARPCSSQQDAAVVLMRCLPWRLAAACGAIRRFGRRTGRDEKGHPAGDLEVQV